MNPIVQQALASLEVVVEKAINEKLDVVVEQQLANLKVAIKGQLDDVVIAQLEPTIKQALKAGLLKLADKIDGQEG